jgi:hypothetical protein
MKQIKLTIKSSMGKFLIIPLLFLFSTMSAQFCMTPTQTVAITPGPTSQTTAIFNTGDAPTFTFNATSNCTYYFQTCGLAGGSDTYLRLHSGVGGALLVSADDQCGVESSFTWVCPSNGVYSVLLTEFSCNALSFAASVSYSAFCTAPCAGAPAATSAVASNSAICANGSSNLSLATTYTLSGLSYQWLSATTASTGPYSPIAAATSPSYAATAIGVTTWYQCVITCTTGPASTTSTPVQVNVSPVPTASANTSATTSICAGQTVAFTSSTNIGTSFYWTGPNSYTSSAQNPTIVSMPANGSGNYNVIVSVNGCSATAVVIPITVNSTNLGITASPQAICGSGSSTLTAVGNATSLVWSTSAITTSIVVSPTATTIYSLTGIGASNCSATAQYTLSVLNPTITGIGQTVCSPTAVATLSANAFAPVSWYATPTSTNALATGNTFTATAATTTTYYAQASSTSSGSLFTTVAGGNGSAGNMFMIVPQTNITINSVDMHINSTNLQNIEVWYRLGNFIGFESSNAGWTQVLTTTVTGLGTGSLTPVPSTFAINAVAGQSLSMYVTTNGGGVAYTNGTTLGNLFASNADLNFYEGKGGSYFGVTFSPRVFNGKLNYSKAGCTSPVIPVVLTSTTAPTVVIASSQPSVCPGGTVNIGVTGANTYTWSTGANGSLISPTVNTTTTYSVIGALSPGCSSTSSITITTGTVPTVSASSTSSLICAGQTVSLTASGANTYSWNTSATTSVVAVSPSVTTSYTVTGTGANGCANISVISQSVAACTGIENNVASTIGAVVYPNPNTGSFTIELNNGSVKTIEVMDLTGRIILTNTLSNDKADFNISGLSNGIYYVRVQSNNSVEVIKIVKQ